MLAISPLCFSPFSHLKFEGCKAFWKLKLFEIPKHFIKTLLNLVWYLVFLFISNGYCPRQTERGYRIDAMSQGRNGDGTTITSKELFGKYELNHTVLQENN
jgi:hypothetical protein